ncbi:MAG: alkaline phosphatase family protein [Acidimicrobiia bacterium]|nr:alkaline phosphatase family protein [Acidimicrobiia bacterium]
MGKSPSYDGSGLVNLVAEIETRLTGGSVATGLTGAELVPDGETYVLVLFDGLGVAQLEHHGARSFANALADVLDAPFPSTTSVSLATIASGFAPSQHGQVAHLTWMPDVGEVVNCLKWVTLGGQPVSYDYPSVLPSPNLWERLRANGVEPITVQPGDFSGSPLSRVLYRGARFEPAWDAEELVTATVQLAAEPGRFIFTYVPYVDFAGHVWGLGSDEFTEAMGLAVSVWERIAAVLPSNAVLLGTADHGLKEFGDEQKLLVRDPRFDGMRFAGDSRGVHVWGETAAVDDLADATGGTLVNPLSLLGAEPSAAAVERSAPQLLLAPADLAVLPKGFDKRLRCYHGGLTPEELQIPLLVG